MAEGISERSSRLISQFNTEASPALNVEKVQKENLEIMSRLPEKFPHAFVECADRDQTPYLVLKAEKKLDGTGGVESSNIIISKNGVIEIFNPSIYNTNGVDSEGNVEYQKRIVNGEYDFHDVIEQSVSKSMNYKELKNTKSPTAHFENYVGILSQKDFRDMSEDDKQSLEALIQKSEEEFSSK